MRKPGGVYKRLTAAGLMVLSWLPVDAPASAEQDFAAGVAAARRQEYSVALRHFESAARAGMREPLLYYNLGVSYYRSGLLDEAEQAFLEATRSPRLAALSYYNLGLIARDRKQREQAISLFKQAESAAQTRQMRRLSALALYHMTGEYPTEHHAAAAFFWAEGSVGYDSNAALAADFIRETEGGSDRTLGFSGYGKYDFTRLRVHGLIRAEHYSEQEDFSFDFLETGASLGLADDAWKSRAGLNGRLMRLGGAALQDSAALWLESSTQAGEFQLKFYLEHESISAAREYEYLAGTRDNIRASAQSPSARWRLVWEAEFNDREDLLDAATGEFLSFSPRRQQLQFEYRDSLTDRTELKVAAGLQNSRYGKPDTRLGEDGAPGAPLRRKDARGRLILEFGYRHWENWRSRLELLFIERDSNFDEYDYDRRALMLNMGRSFGQ